LQYKFIDFSIKLILDKCNKKFGGILIREDDLVANYPDLGDIIFPNLKSGDEKHIRECEEYNDSKLPD